MYAFLEKFQLTTDDQLGLLPKIEIDKLELTAVAAEWIKNNEAVWKAWLS